MTPPGQLSDRERVDVLLDEVCRLRRENVRLIAQSEVLTAASFEMMTESSHALLRDPEDGGWKVF